MSERETIACKDRVYKERKQEWKRKRERERERKRERKTKRDNIISAKEENEKKKKKKKKKKKQLMCNNDENERFFNAVLFNCMNRMIYIFAQIVVSFIYFNEVFIWMNYNDKI